MKPIIKPTSSTEKIAKEILKKLEKEKDPDQPRFNFIKRETIRKHKGKNPQGKVPSNIEIASFATRKQIQKLRDVLTIKPVRSQSGVSVIAIMTKPHNCPHGRCITCPGGVDSFFGSVPQSYTGKEPATRRAIRNRYDPYLQVFNRLEQYYAMNKEATKIELIIMGGTFPSLTKRYQDNFVMNSFKAMNDFSSEFLKKGILDEKKFRRFFELPSDIDDEERTKRINKKVTNLKQLREKSLEHEQKRNESADIRCVGMTIETRPDFAGQKEIDQMLRLGCTRVEIGVQSVYDNALENINRGHTVQDSVEAIKLLKNSAFKINFHMMLGIPGITPQEDIRSLEMLFEDERFMPDMLKLYPCMILKGTKLYDMYKRGKFNPLTTEQAVSIISEFKRKVPKFCRIMRVQRDIPTNQTEAGVGITNLRQKISELNTGCRCIRCREIGSRKIISKPEFEIIEYKASEGKEFFISLVDKKQDALVGFARMRYPSGDYAKNPGEFRKEIISDSALIRELHVYGESVKFSQNKTSQNEEVQHKGFGKRLMKKAEEIASKEGKKKMIVISGVGVRGYYRKMGYTKQGPYMVKKIISKKTNTEKTRRQTPKDKPYKKRESSL